MKKNMKTVKHRKNLKIALFYYYCKTLKKLKNCNFFTEKTEYFLILTFLKTNVTNTFETLFQLIFSNWRFEVKSVIIIVL